MKQQPTPEDRQRILDLHKEHGVNHVIFLLDYCYDADDVNQVLRERVAALEGALDCFAMLARVSPGVFHEDADALITVKHPERDYVFRLVTARFRDAQKVLGRAAQAQGGTECRVKNAVSNVVL